jgi:hypothetical protein
MGSPKKTTTRQASKKTKPTNSTNKNRTVTAKVTASDVRASKKAVKQQLTTDNFIQQSKTAAKNKSFAEAFSNPEKKAVVTQTSADPTFEVSLEEIRSTIPKPVVRAAPVPVARAAPYESYKPVRIVWADTRLVPFRSFLPEGHTVFINISSITSIQNYTTHTDTVQIGLSSGLTQLVRHSLSEVLEMISE